MATKDKFETIIDIQEKTKLYTFEYKGVSLWPFLRIIIGYNEDLQGQKYSKKEIDFFFKSGFRKELDSFIYSLKISREYKNQTNSVIPHTCLKSDVLLLSNDFLSAQSPGNLFFNEWMSPLEYCLKKGIAPTIASFFVQGKDDHSFLLDVDHHAKYLDLNKHRKAHFNKAFGHFIGVCGIKKQVKDVDGIKELFYLLEQSSLGLTMSIDQLTLRVEMLLLLIKDFVVFFKRNSTKTLMVYAFYSDVMLAAVYAAKSLGITVVDVQHGLIGPYHFAYTKWNGIDKKKLMFLPDYCFTWDAEITDFINESSGTVLKAYYTGNLSMAYKIGIANKRHETYFNEGIENKASLHVLISTGVKTLPQQIIELINSDKNVFWHLKLHPRYTTNERRAYYQNVIRNQNAKIYSGNDMDLHELFALCQIHITEESTVAIEAEQFGLKNIIVTETGKDMFENYIQDGRFLYCNCENIKSLTDLVHDQKKYVKTPLSIQNSMEAVASRINSFLDRNHII